MSSRAYRRATRAESQVAKEWRRAGWEVLHLAPSGPADLVAWKLDMDDRLVMRLIEVKSSIYPDRLMRMRLTVAEELLRERCNQRIDGKGARYVVERVLVSR